MIPEIDADVSVEEDEIVLAFASAPAPQDVTVYVDDRVTFVDGSRVPSGTSYELTIAEPAHVVSSIPATGVVLDDLSQPLTVTFSVPMVGLTDLDQRDDALCPLTISPRVDGTCKRLSTSVLQFVPTAKRAPATRYEVTVQTDGKKNKTQKKTGGLLFVLDEAYTFDFETVALQVSVDKEFSLLSGIVLSFNVPVAQDDLQRALTLSHQTGTDDDDKPVYETVQTRLKKLTDARYAVWLVGDDLYKSDESYRIKIDNSLTPQGGQQ